MAGKCERSAACRDPWNHGTDHRTLICTPAYISPAEQPVLVPSTSAKPLLNLSLVNPVTWPRQAPGIIFLIQIAPWKLGVLTTPPARVVAAEMMIVVVDEFGLVERGNFAIIVDAEEVRVV